MFFSFICFRQKYLKCTFAFFYMFGCRLISQQVFKRVSSNIIRKKTGCDKYLEDQLNMASINLAKYPFDEKYGK